MDIVTVNPGERQLIEGYGTTGFRVSGVLHARSILIFPERTMEWSAEVSEAGLAAVAAHGGIDILLLGCGRSIVLVPQPLRQKLRTSGIIIDAMDTGAACRTYNLLLAEDRRVAAALVKLG